MSNDPTESGTSREVALASATVRYHDLGEGHPIVLLHGSGPGATAWSNFRPNIPELACRFRVLALDLPGWGGSQAVPMAERDHPRTVVEFLDALGIEKAALVGNSMGGVVSLAVAALHPDRVSHLITMGPASKPRPGLFGPGGGPSEGMKILFAGYQDPSQETMRRLVDIMSYSSGDAADGIAAERAAAAQGRPDHLKHFLEGLATGSTPITRWATPQELMGITAPSLLIHGRDDRVVHFEASLELVSLIPDSRLVLFNRCGHWAQLEHAAEFNRLVTDFVSNN
ncbi:alpha/beta hydrolase [Streptomyces sp. NPDC052052]|uniref:alpha/beta fold hydrolase n=1 Tax=Streptomyces sp. NPDC052052 TaxID=3154756 RepID=UPI0034255453